MKLKLFAVSSALVFFTATSVLAAGDPYNMADNSWVSISGTVVATDGDSFELDYGDGIVTVEMDGWGWFKRAEPILREDQVIVYGYIDDDFYESTSIEAGSVYVREMNTYFYANDVDEEEMSFPTVLDASGENLLQLRGVVTAIDGRELTVDTGPREMIVDTSQMDYNPLDDKGYQKLKTGDFVIVQGDLDKDVFERAEIMADVITSLEKDTTKKTKS